MAQDADHRRTPAADRVAGKGGIQAHHADPIGILRVDKFAQTGLQEGERLVNLGGIEVGQRVPEGMDAFAESVRDGHRGAA